MQTAEPILSRKSTRLVLALSLPFLTCWLQYLFWAHIEPRVWFYFYPSLFISILLAGPRGGVPATVLSVLLVDWFFLEPGHLLVPDHPRDILNSVEFLIIGIGLSFWVDHLQHRQEALMQSLKDQSEDANRFRVMFEQAPLGITLVDSLSGRVIESNSRYADMIGRTREELACIDWMQITHPDDLQADLDNMARVNAGEISNFWMEKRFIKPDGATSWVSMTVAPFESHLEEGPRHLCMMEDITERRAQQRALTEAQAQLRETANERRLGALIEQSSVGVAVLDTEGHYQRVNDQFCEMLGYSREDLLGLTVQDLTDPRDWAISRDLLNRQKTKPGSFCQEKRKRHKSGNSFWCLVTGGGFIDPDTQQTTLIELVIDINESKQQAQDLQRAHQLLADAERIAHMGAWQYIAATRETIWSDGECRIFGIEPGSSPDYDAMLKHCTHPEDAKRLDQAFFTALAEAAPFEFEYRIVRPDGQQRIIWSIAHPELDTEGQVARYVGISLDVTEQRRTTADLRQGAEHLRLAIESSHTGIWHWDLLTHQHEWSALCRKLLALPAEQSPSYDHFVSVLHADDRERVIQEVMRAQQTHQDYDTQYRVIQPSGDVIWLEARGCALYDADGEAIAMLGTVRDITARRQAEEALQANERRFRSLFENLPIAYQSLDIEGRFIDANQRLIDLLGVETLDHLLGKSFGDFWDDAIHDQFSGQFGQFMVSGQTQSTLPLNRADGKPVTVLLTGCVQRDDKGHFLHTHCILLDITERAALEQQMLDLNAELERMVARRTEQLQTSLESRTRFLANMSHEIRTPMNSVLGLAQLLMEEPLPDEAKGMVETILRTGRSLQMVINDILDLSKLEAGRMGIELRPFGLGPLLARVDSLMGSLARGKGLALRIDDQAKLDDRLVGDELRIEQVLLNLTGNAVKFTESGSVTLRVKILETQASRARLRFEVQDTGIGIAPEQKAQLFQSYQQADDSIARRFGGTGLGLALSKQLVELMGGTIGAESEPGHGSTFWFELPFERTEAPASPIMTTSAQESGPSLSHLHVLVVDDNQINRLIVKNALFKRGITVTQAVDGQQAVDLLRAQPKAYDLVLMDVQMPVMNGLEATRLIRRELRLDRLPVIALTAGVMPEEKQEAFDAGVNEFLGKPINFADMEAVLKKYGSLPPSHVEDGSGS